MFTVFNASWALFLGMFMLMIGNGLQGTLLGLRADVEGFTTTEDFHRDVGLFCGLSIRLQNGAEPDPPRWARAGLCGTWIHRLGSLDLVPSVG